MTALLHSSEIKIQPERPALYACKRLPEHWSCIEVSDSICSAFSRSSQVLIRLSWNNEPVIRQLWVNVYNSNSKDTIKASDTFRHLILCQIAPFLPPISHHSKKHHHHGTVTGNVLNKLLIFIYEIYQHKQQCFASL